MVQMSKEATSLAQVTLVIPWLAVPDQKMVFPKGITFETPELQEHYVREWAQKRTGLPCNFKVRLSFPLHPCCIDLSTNKIVETLGLPKNIQMSPFLVQNI